MTTIDQSYAREKYDIIVIKLFTANIYVQSTYLVRAKLIKKLIQKIIHFIKRTDVQNEIREILDAVVNFVMIISKTLLIQYGNS